jgi:hypothetical protein
LGIEGKAMPSNKSYGEWGELLGDNVLASAIQECGFCEDYSLVYRRNWKRLLWLMAVLGWRLLFGPFSL